MPSTSGILKKLKLSSQEGVIDIMDWSDRFSQTCEEESQTEQKIFNEIESALVSSLESSCSLDETQQKNTENKKTKKSNICSKKSN